MPLAMGSSPSRSHFWSSTSIFQLRCSATYGEYRGALVIYGANLVVTGVLLVTMHWYATAGRRLVVPALNKGLVRSARRRLVIGPASYLVAIAVALLQPRIGSVMWAQIDARGVAPRAHHFIGPDEGAGLLILGGQEPRYPPSAAAPVGTET